MANDKVINAAIAKGNLALAAHLLNRAIPVLHQAHEEHALPEKELHALSLARNLILENLELTAEYALVSPAPLDS